MFKGGDKVRIILGSGRVAQVIGFETTTRGYQTKIRFDDGLEMLENEECLFIHDDPELLRIESLWRSLKTRELKHIVLIRKSGDPKIYYKAFNHTQEYLKILALCEQKSTKDTKYSVIRVM